MKVQTKSLVFNPFRSSKIPLNEEKIKQLETNIESTGFWDNIVARKNDGKFEIAYGHHRLEALKRLKIHEVDIPIKDLDDETMIKMMAQENMEEWFHSPLIALETVKTAYLFLQKRGDEVTGALVANFIKWPEKRVKDSIATLRNFGEINGSKDAHKEFQKEIDLDKESVKKLPTMKHISGFRKSVRELKPSRKVQKIVADKISKSPEEIPAKEIEAEIKDTMKMTGELKKEPKIKPRPELNEFVEKQLFGMMSQIESKLVKLKGMTQYLSSYQYKIFRTKLKELNSVIQILLKEVESE